MKFFSDKRYEPFRQFLLMWSILFLFMVLESGGELFKDTKRGFIALPVLLAIIALTVVVHYYCLFDRYAANRKYRRYLLLLAVYLALAILLDWLFGSVLSAFGLWEIEEGLTYPLIVSMQRVLVADMPLAFVYAAIRHFYKTKQAQAQLETAHHKNEMLLLRSKLEPAFVYAAINALQATAENETAPQTAACLGELKELFRYSSEDANKEYIPIAGELTFIDRYVQLQKMRIVNDGNVAITYQAKTDDAPAHIAPMLILPFIENAFKYGVSYERPFSITIIIEVKAQHMELHIENTDHSGKSRIDSTGTGLANTIKRLNLQYKSKYSLEQKNENGIYAVSLKLDLS